MAETVTLNARGQALVSQLAKYRHYTHWYSRSQTVATISGESPTTLKLWISPALMTKMSPALPSKVLPKGESMDYARIVTKSPAL
jgi:hypothetical protein